MLTHPRGCVCVCVYNACVCVCVSLSLSLSLSLTLSRYRYMHVVHVYFMVHLSANHTYINLNVYKNKSLKVRVCVCLHPLQTRTDICICRWVTGLVFTAALQDRAEGLEASPSAIWWAMTHFRSNLGIRMIAMISAKTCCVIG